VGPQQRIPQLRIATVKEFGPSPRSRKAYLKIDDDLKTTKRRVAAITKASPFVKKGVRGPHDEEAEDELRSIIDGTWAKEDGDASDGSSSEASTREEEVKIDYASQRAILLGRSVTAMFLLDVSNPCHYLTPCRQTSSCRHPNSRR
jgi:hypothetical protein